MWNKKRRGQNASSLLNFTIYEIANRTKNQLLPIYYPHYS
jgi:hypothetical protein